jgi:UDP-3-O-[3-hydroxymyristoyl] N-acetylglucosamine deacetylase/3-hydroxyacyl-[acyl-carrier-protein] dehydratase
MLMAMNQRTIKEEVCFSGKALQTGRMVNAVCRPAEPDKGIVFKRTDLPEAPVLCLKDAVFSGTRMRRSTVGDGALEVQTVEHFLAALWALGIDNLLVELDGAELPALDGSAAGFFKRLKETGSVEQASQRHLIKIMEEERVEEEGRSLAVFPDDAFTVSYFIEYDIPSIGREVFDITLDQDSFEKEIAPARTFCLKSEAEALLKAGLGQGADLENTLVMDDDGPVGTTLRFPNEPVRHKVLDLIGDLYMLGRPIAGKVVAEKSGHSLNAKMVRKIYDKYVRT